MNVVTCMSGYPITLNLILSFTHITLDIFTDLLSKFFFFKTSTLKKNCPRAYSNLKNQKSS